ncbi:hypothetical protein [Natronocalculus amylovorans]|uniref:Uncharacterized protein n=1 Tax=Natronocalculus amylovorans TaxID=2917812 RepID=A0AAE3G027_9EURY|nr:hypothetical protein [Natronocalculus amylovorans]MCL9818370.1 hypothetical protein [Natronocalculus amylovorans]
MNENTPCGVELLVQRSDRDDRLEQPTSVRDGGLITPLSTVQYTHTDYVTGDEVPMIGFTDTQLVAESWLTIDAGCVVDLSEVR